MFTECGQNVDAATEEKMYTDSLIFEPISCSIQVNYPVPSAQFDARQSEGVRIAQALRSSQT